MSVLIEENGQLGFQMIDSITIPIDFCSLSSPRQRYDGMYEIASIELGYQLSLLPEEYAQLCFESGEFHALTNFDLGL